ncbi:unnamed protein product [Trifolium pratense]|uniref:Uncharacterized protein n=1 Tax=Trifolium pratense TaxID=57577 RepID=A0ACB0IK90_TRIPR|nr:unnamed protein product [Trifolium pratense]
MRNFIWSGDIDKRKLVTTSWKKICRPFAQGGLNLRSLSKLNKVTNLTLCWSLMNSQSSWATLLKDRVFRKKRIIKHHIFSSLWSSIKDEFGVIMDNSTWILGNGEDINFWNDNWCGTSLSDLFRIPTHISQLLTSTVSDYLVNGHWVIPPQLTQAFNNLIAIVNQVIIPLEPCQDHLLWNHTDSGDLQLKAAYQFKMQNFQDLHWAKTIWNSDIPPSKSLLVWRLMLNKVPTDENLMIRGCYMPSMCSICKSQVESSFHIFFECSFAVRTWSWLAGCLNLVLQFSSIEDIWKLCDLNWSPQCKTTLTAAIINLINTLWFVRNQARFNNKLMSWDSAIAMIIANTTLTGNNTCKSSSNSIRDFNFLKFFRINIHQPKPTYFKEVCWLPPLVNWLKCNVDGASNGNPGNASCGGIFRNHSAEFVFGFAEPLGITTSYFAELCGAMRAFEIASQNNWHNIWIETDSTLVVSAFQNPDKPIFWSLRNRWKNVLHLAKSMNFIVTHIFREGNQVADLLANHGLTLISIAYWQEAPLFIRDCFDKNKLGIPCFRLCSF